MVIIVFEVRMSLLGSLMFMGGILVMDVEY